MNPFPIFERTPELPAPADAGACRLALERWQEMASGDRADAPRCRLISESPEAMDLLRAIFGNSPHLTQSIFREPAFFADILSSGPETAIARAFGEMEESVSQERDNARFMKALRIAKRRVGLAIAVADITGTFELMQVTGTLSDLADRTLDAATRFVLAELSRAGHITDKPLEKCGFCIIGMGKLGSRELNYSSDIDIIVLYDTQRMGAEDPDELRHLCVRATRQLARIMEERTADGYVFRTDLRLRPDPSATPLAMTVLAAETYYESLGQNWERAAMIKARPVAGDKDLAQEFLDHIRPFVWRKHLDFAAINDIHSIKRQINAYRGGAKIAIEGHDIKIGRGGIREIEFYAQTLQLIWGGREPELRVRRTCDALEALSRNGHIEPDTVKELIAAYEYLRNLEHRLQMIEDKQTQKLPETPEGIRDLAVFSGYNEEADFRNELRATLERVEYHYARLFEDTPDLTHEGSLVFTGAEDDPDTLETLKRLGFKEASGTAARIRAWHHGRTRATRSVRARELLTELMPALLDALSRTANPDQAIARFDSFLEGLPAGVQLFSLFYANPRLLELVALIMGNAPRLSEWLSRKPILLDAVLSPDFFDPDEPAEAMRESLGTALAQSRDFEDTLDITRRWASDHKFQVGVQILRGIIDGEHAGPVLTDVAETVINSIAPITVENFSRTHGTVHNGELAVLAFGKMGGRELMPMSDLDLVLIYDHPEDIEGSDGQKPLSPAVYYLRLCQRILTSLTAQTGEGKLYEVDLRLRPAGNSGPLATQLATFNSYYNGEAWTWEHMALTRARPVHGSDAMRKRLAKVIREALCQKRDPENLLRDVAKMRERIAREFPGTGAFDIKYRPGGLVDIEFIAQYLQLLQANENPEVLSVNTAEALKRLAEAGYLDSTRSDDLLDALSLWRRIQSVIRLTASGEFKEDTAPEGQKRLLADAGEVASFSALKDRMEEAAQKASRHFEELVRKPAADLPPPGTDN